MAIERKIQASWIFLFLHSTLHVGADIIADDLTDFDLSQDFPTFPMLFYSSDDEPNFRDAATTTHRHLTEELKVAVEIVTSNPKLLPPLNQADFSGSWNEVYGNNLPPLALYYVLYETDLLLNFLKDYMDRMASYKSWHVTQLPRDEVPMAHSLTGFATAYDMLYPYLDEERRELYGNKIVQMTHQLFDLSHKRSWGRHYLQNHQATNVVALLIGSLVSEVYLSTTISLSQEEAAQWKTHAVTLYERTMSLLSFIEDGSLDEGVGYVGYTVKSLTQYVYLVKRHFQYDHSAHPWLSKHFRYIYNTIIPGMGRTVGIADSPQGWFYGPESQLVFLDAFVMRNGHGYWLAEQIRRNKIPIMSRDRPHSQNFTTLHTEFMFYDPMINPHPPPGYQHSELVHFKDWGVVNYRSGSILDSKETFISFKSSYLHGRAIYYIANRGDEDIIKGWHSFNPGHEHADQNSFTLWMDGVPFVTDGLYGPKLPYLDNVIMFHATTPESQTTSCTKPWVGQLGTCGKWLTWTSKEEQKSHGEILLAQEKNGIVFTLGDSANAYPSVIGVEHAFRSVIVLQKDLLVVIDNIILDKQSPVREASVFFNNFMNHFVATVHKSGLHGFSLLEDTSYTAFWVSADNKSPSAGISTQSYTSCDRLLNTSNANITFPLASHFSSWVFVFHGPNVNVNQLAISTSESLWSTDVLLGLLDREMQIQLSTKEEDTFGNVRDSAGSTTWFKSKTDESHEKSEHRQKSKQEAVRQPNTHFSVTTMDTPIAVTTINITGFLYCFIFVVYKLMKCNRITSRNMKYAFICIGLMVPITVYYMLSRLIPFHP